MFLKDDQINGTEVSHRNFESRYTGLDFDGNTIETSLESIGLNIAAFSGFDDFAFASVDLTGESLFFSREPIGLLLGRTSRLNTDDLVFDDGTN